MPLYEYRDNAGNVIELRRPVEERNHSVVVEGRLYHRHRFIPARVAVILPGPTPDQQFNREVRRGYYAREQEEGSRFKNREGLNKKQLAELWSDIG